MSNKFIIKQLVKQIPNFILHSFCKRTFILISQWDMKSTGLRALLVYISTKIFVWNCECFVGLCSQILSWTNMCITSNNAPVQLRRSRSLYVLRFQLQFAIHRSNWFSGKKTKIYIQAIIGEHDWFSWKENWVSGSVTIWRPFTWYSIVDHMVQMIQWGHHVHHFNTVSIWYVCVFYYAMNGDQSSYFARILCYSLSLLPIIDVLSITW